MIRYLLMYLLLISNSCLLSGQDNCEKLDIEYFLLGTLDDNLGRQFYSELGKQVDSYYKYEKSIVLTLDSMFRNIYPDFEVLFRNSDSKYVIYSKQLVSNLNKYYVFKPTELVTMTNDTLYTGYLKNNIFSNDLQKLSFISGVFARFGEPNDTICCIRIYNSLSKSQLCLNLLNELHCLNVKYVVLNYHIPISNILYFRPSIKLMEYLNKIMYLRKQLNIDMNLQLKK